MGGARVLHVVSHGPHCFDGVVAAVAVARFHPDRDVRVRFASNQEINRVLRELEPEAGEELWITDISWNDPEADRHLAALIERRIPVHWFDHHRTAIERLKAGGYRLDFATRVVRDDFAASKLVYDFLAQRAADSESRGGPGAPSAFRSFAPVVAMADDNDRWLHRIPGSREMGLVVRAMPAGEAYRSLLEIDSHLTDTPAMAAARARVTEELERNRRLAESTRNERAVGSVRLVAALCDGYAGEIADEWGRSSPRSVFALFDVRSRSISLRRSPDLDFDLSKLAETLGGGGHPAAAGASVGNLPALLGEAVGAAVAGKMSGMG